MGDVTGALEFVLDPAPVVRERAAQRPSPALRRLGVREVFDASSGARKVGYPSSINADAWLGHSVMERDGSEVAFTSCDVGRGVLVRFVAHASRGHSGSKKELAQRAKVGFSRAAPPWRLLPLPWSPSMLSRPRGCSCGRSWARGPDVI